VNAEVVSAYVALGANLGDRAATLHAAVCALEAEYGIDWVTRSPLYETDPVGGPAQGPYLNAVCELRTALPARALLEWLLGIEARTGRTRGAERNAPRLLDLDLLLYGNEVIDEPDLVVPHPRLHERAFVLEPLAAIAPEVVHPTLGVSVRLLAARARDPGGVRRLPAELCGAWRAG